MTRRKGSTDNPKWMKREAIKLYLEEGFSTGELLARYSINDPNRISAWARQYQVEGDAIFADKRRCSGRKPKKEDAAAQRERISKELV